MNVILLEKVGRLGSVGDQATVKAGYARNFLFPQGKAVPATKENLKNFQNSKLSTEFAIEAIVQAPRTCHVVTFQTVFARCISITIGSQML